MYCSARSHFNSRYIRPISGKNSLILSAMKVEENSMKATNTSNTLTSCFTSCIGFENSCVSFHKQLQRILQKCFTKIRINGGGNKFIGNKVTQAFLGARRQSESFIRTVTCNFGLTLLKNFLNKLERSLNHIEEVSNTNKIRIYINSCEVNDGTFSQNGFWKLKKKLCPSSKDPPMAEYDEKGNLVTNPNTLKTVYLKAYTKRLAQRDIRP